MTNYPQAVARELVHVRFTANSTTLTECACGFLCPSTRLCVCEKVQNSFGTKEIGRRKQVERPFARSAQTQALVNFFAEAER